MAADKSVAIVGGGPAGKAAAREFRKAGLGVTIFEKEPHSGGLLRYGYPAWRMPDDVSAKDARTLERLGVVIKTGQELGRNLEFRDLERNFGAIVFAVGSATPRQLHIPGENLPGVFEAIHFLHQAREQLPPVGQRVIVVGAGDTAMDVATTALSLGAGKVEIMYRRSEAEIPAQQREVEIARKAGAEFRYLESPTRIEPEDSRLKVMIQRMKLGQPDATGRRRPESTTGEYHEVVDHVIVAIGQEPDAAFFAKYGLRVRADGTTNQPNVFSAGEMHYGADKLARAILDGRQVADMVITHLSR